MCKESRGALFDDIAPYFPSLFEEVAQFLCSGGSVVAAELNPAAPQWWVCDPMRDSEFTRDIDCERHYFQDQRMV